MFLNSVMLAGLGAAALPLVLHLLSRARYRSVDWGAMMFLRGADSRQRQSTQVKQWILLLVRMATVGLLAVALARPIVRGSWARVTEQGQVTAVVALDCSASMAYDENGHTRFEMARQAASQILSNFRAGDQGILLLIGLDQSDEELQPTADLHALTQRLLNVVPGTGQTDIASALTRAAGLLDRDSETNRELYLITDSQAINWSNVDTAFETAWRARARSSSPMRFVVVPVGNDDRENVAVESVQLVNPPALRQQPAQVQIRLRNYGDVARSAWPLRVMRGDVELLRTTVNLSPDGTADMKLPVTFDAIGPQVITASIEPAGPPMDDELSVVVDVIEPIRVLFISGDEREEPFRGESGFFRTALTPFASAGQAGSDPAAVEVVAADKWNDVNIDAYQVIVLANVSQITEVQARSIEQFVMAGGGLLISPGSLSRLQNYNDMLGAILPGAFELPADAPSATQLLSVDRAHPVFRFVQDGVNALPGAAIARWVPVRPKDQFGEVIAVLRNREPLLLESNPGEGRVLLLTTSLDADWNALPLSTFYLPMMQSAVRYLAGDASSRLNLLPGSVFEWDLELAADDGVPMIVGPDGNRRPAEVRPGGERVKVRYDQTREAGQYTLERSHPTGTESILFVVRPVPGESDLTPLNPAQWDRMAAGLDFERTAPDPSSLAAATSGARASRELWPVLLALVAILAAGELLLARIWSEERS